MPAYKERQYRQMIRRLLGVIDDVTFVDSRGDRYAGFREDTTINDMVDDDVAAAEKLLKPARKRSR